MPGSVIMQAKKSAIVIINKDPIDDAIGIDRGSTSSSIKNLEIYCLSCLKILPFDIKQHQRSNHNYKG